MYLKQSTALLAFDIIYSLFIRKSPINGSSTKYVYRLYTLPLALSLICPDPYNNC